MGAGQRHRKKKARIRYHSLNQNRSASRKIDPYAVYFDPDGVTLKLIMFDPLHAAIRVFSVEAGKGKTWTNL